MGRLLYAFILVPLIFIAACTTKPIAIEKEEGIEEDLKVLAGTTSKYYRFNKAHYENSIQEGKVVFLDFHANWCPICARENPKILAAFNELDNENIVGYQVHYNDGETNDDDKEIAKKYGVTYQYTKIILDKNDNVALKTLEILDKDRIINEINKAAGG